MKPYSAFAQIYDTCMDNVPYDEWASRIIELFRINGVPEGAIVADLGCGTGAMSRKLSDAGYDVIGIDSSEEMLMTAQDNEYERLYGDMDDTFSEEETELSEDPRRITYLCQDIRSFELYGTVAGVVSVCDTMNYLLTDSDLVKTFRLVNNYLERDGVFVFDMKTPHYYEKVLGNRVRVEDYEDFTLLWDNAYDPKTRMNEYSLTMFVKEDDDRYVRNDEEHCQRAYTLAEIRRLIEKSGMVFVAAYDAYTELPATEESERFVIVAREGFQEHKYYG
ncbi:MAG: class I SAM-dependent methyltransferase [Lachnospiraceae bacterium]|nr:class I SAM-dependent methyltransferase [Lachnospiraceae bacterium]